MSYRIVYLGGQCPEANQRILHIGMGNFMGMGSIGLGEGVVLGDNVNQAVEQKLRGNEPH